LQAKAPNPTLPHEKAWGPQNPLLRKIALSLKMFSLSAAGCFPCAKERAMANAAKVQVSGSPDGDAATAHVDTFARQHLPPPDLWPEFIFTRPELRYPARLNCVSYFLDRWVEQGHGDAPCVISPAVSYTYRELQALVNRIANVLVGKLGLVTGGRVLLRSANSPMMVA